MRALLDMIWWLLLMTFTVIGAGAILVGLYSFVVGDNHTGSVCIGILVALLVGAEILKPRGVWGS